MITMKQINADKKVLASKLDQLISPVMWESGFVKDRRPMLNVTGMVADEHLKLYVFRRDCKEAGALIERKVPRISSFQGNDGAFGGYVEGGVITDGYAGGLVTLSYSCMPIEDLLLLLSWVRKHPQWHQPLT